jgi:hypothetical protein
MKLRTLTAAAIAAAFSLGAPVAAQASSSIGCSVPRSHAFGLIHNLREHGTTCTMARGLASFSLNGPNGYHRWIYTGSRTWTVTVKTSQIEGGVMGTETMRSGSSWITFRIWR